MKRTRLLNLVTILVLLVVMVPAAKAGPPSGTWVSGIACQNLGTGDATISLIFYAEGSATPVLSYTDPTVVPAGKSRNYYTPSSFPTLPSGFMGSAVVSATEPMACAMNWPGPWATGSWAGKRVTRWSSSMSSPIPAWTPSTPF